MSSYHLTHLKQLEAEGVHIIREVAAEFENPVMLYSIGKDSAVMLQLAMKAFYPGKPPFPLLHVDTTWKFREMIQFRDRLAHDLGLDLIVHINEEGVRQGVNPFTYGSKKHTDIMKTESLKQALDKYKFDAALPLQCLPYREAAESWPDLALVAERFAGPAGYPLHS